MSNQQPARVKMRMIEFSDYDEEEFLEYLALQEGDTLELQMPKRTVLYRSSHRQFVAEYARMALLGEKLDALGPGFSWWPPPIQKKGEFLFFVPLKDPAALAPLLVMARDLCEAGLERGVSYDYEASCLLDNFKGDSHPCFDYLVLAFQFSIMGEREFGI